MGFNDSQALPPREATGGSYLPKSELSHVLDNIPSLVALEIRQFIGTFEHISNEPLPYLSLDFLRVK